MSRAGDKRLLRGEEIRLRALEPEDIEILYAWENDPSVWGVSGTLAPFSRETLSEFIDNQKYDIYRTRQLRLVICRLQDDAPLGFIDLFDFDPVNLRAGVGILICSEEERRKGYAREALELLCDYASGVLGIHQLWANIDFENFPSQKLFSGAKFVIAGTLKDWSRREGSWRDEIVFQRIF